MHQQVYYFPRGEGVPAVRLNAQCHSHLELLAMPFHLMIQACPPTKQLPTHASGPRMLERISRSVFSCFHRFERALTRFTDSVGPACVFFCTVLLVLGIITFCELRKRYHSCVLCLNVYKLTPYKQSMYSIMTCS